MILQASASISKHIASKRTVCNTGARMDLSTCISEVQRLYQRGDTYLVFPSEVIAQGWRRALVSVETGPAAIRTDRIVSWDVFKERAIPIKEDRRPASKLYRLIFADALIEENAESPFLTSLIHREYARERPNVAGVLAQLLPQLFGLMGARDRLGSETGKDLGEIFQRYRDFLNRCRLFEPNWELRGHVRLDHVPWRPVIFWPGLLEDFPDYRDELLPHVEIVELVSPGGDGRGYTPAPAAVYRGSREEIRALCDQIEQDLDSGVEFHEIAISAGDLNSLRPWLSAEATRRDIPIRYADGSPVIEQPGGTVFQRIDEVARGDFGVTSLAALLKDHSVPWKDGERHRKLCDFGFAAHCYDRTAWREAFRIVPELSDDRQRRRYGAMEGYYRSLERAILALSGATSAGALRRAFRQFADRYIADRAGEMWKTSGYSRVERVYETALGQLRSIVNLEENGLNVPKPWRFFLTLLSDSTYVFPAAGEAIPVYSYRVAAGLPVRKHYVIGLGQAATRVRRMTPLGIRSDEAKRIYGQKADRSAAFLHAYGGAVGNTICSCSLDTPGGAQVPAAELLWPELEFHPRENHWDVEEYWWSHRESGAPTSLYLRQATGLERALSTTLMPVSANYQYQPVHPDVLPLLRRPETWSPTTIDRFSRCPFAFFLQEGLGVQNRIWGYFPANPPLMGTILHRIMARAIKAGVADVAGIVTEEFGRPEGKLFLPRIGTDVREVFFVAVVRMLLDHPELGKAAQQAGRDESTHAVSTRAVTEHKLVLQLDSINLKGTADLIIRGDGGDTIIDYKSRLRPEHGPGKIFPEDGEYLRDSSTLQLPLYSLMYGHGSGRPVNRLVYVDLTSAEVKVIADRAGNQRVASAWERLQRVLEQLPDYIGRIEEMVSTGELRCDDNPDCSACRVRSMCRSCFVTRRFSGDS